MGRPNLSREKQFSGANGDLGRVWRLSTLTGDRTAERIPRDQILRCERGFRLNVENEHPDAGRDGRTCLETKSSGVNGDSG